MKKSVALIVVLLVVSSVAILAPSGVQAQQGNIKVLNYTHYIDSAGYLDLVGEIQNVGTVTVANVTLYASVTGDLGTSVQQYSVVLGNYILPGEKVPFYIEIHTTSGTYGFWDGGELTDSSVVVSDAPVTGKSQYQDLSITNKASGIINSAFWANATVTNTGSQTARVVTIFGTFYNSAGKVVGTGWSKTVDSIAPGATVEMDTPAFDLNQSTVASDQRISAYKLRLDVQQPIINGATPTRNPSNTVNPTDNPTTPAATDDDVVTVTPGASQPQDNNLTIIIAAVAAIAVVAVIVGVVLLKRRRPSKKQPEKVQPASKAKQGSRRNKK